MMTIHAKDCDSDFYSHGIQVPPFSERERHAHDWHELYYLEKGTVAYYFDSSKYVLHAGDMIFVPKRTYHKVIYDGDISAERSLFNITDELEKDDFRAYIKDLHEIRHIKFQTDKVYILYDLLGRIRVENNNRWNNFLEMEQLYFRQFLILASRYRVRPEVQDFGKQDDIIKKATEYINQNINEDLSLNTLSKRFYLSPTHLSRQFKKVTGMGLSQYINETRVAAAKNMLVNTDSSITEVAMQCGFNDSNYFSCIFKKTTGITPKKFALHNS